MFSHALTVRELQLRTTIRRRSTENADRGSIQQECKLSLGTNVRPTFYATDTHGPFSLAFSLMQEEHYVSA